MYEKRAFKQGKKRMKEFSMWKWIENPVGWYVQIEGETFVVFAFLALSQRLKIRHRTAAKAYTFNVNYYVKLAKQQKNGEAEINALEVLLFFFLLFSFSF